MIMKLDLQYFADQEADEKVDTQEADEQQKQEKTFTRDDIAKMISAEKKKWQEEKDQEIEEAKSEGERLAKLSKDEREKEQDRKRKEALDQREKDVAMKELRIETRSILAEEGLPQDFLDVVIADSAEKIQENVNNIRVVFDEAVEKRVDERLQTSAAKRGGHTHSTGLTREEIMREPDIKKRYKMIRENRDLF